MFNNKLDQYRPEVCPVIEKSIVNFFTHFSFFEHILEHIIAPRSILEAGEM